MEDQKQLLFSASQELERVRFNAAKQKQIHERRLLQLEELLTATVRERDEARERLVKLEQSLAENYNMQTNGQQDVMSSDLSQWPETDLDINPSIMHYNSFSQSTHAPTPVDPFPHHNSSPLVGLTDQFFWNSSHGNHFDLQPDVHLHGSVTSSSNLQYSNLMELQDQPFYHHKEQQLSLVERQESEQQDQVESHLLVSPPVGGCTPTAMPAHLSEPAEIEFLVGQTALPERGKLLQAVMQAGPLLQTLPSTGSLPQWRNPPPVLDSAEIPRISMCSSPDILKPLGPPVHHVPNPQGPADALNPLQESFAVSSSHDCPPAIINEPPTASIFTIRLSGSEAAPSSSESIFAPVLNSLDSSSITANLPLKFSQIY